MLDTEKDNIDKKNTDNENTDEYMDNNGPGLDKQGAMYLAQQAGENVSPCGYCNRGDCMECAFSR